jgi:hypothetical protein
MSNGQKEVWQRPGYREGRCGVNHPNFQNWKSKEPYCPRWTKDLKERIRAFWNYKCGMCCKTQAENGELLSTHHVHYRKDACCNEEMEWMFIPLCRKCHAKTGHVQNKERWIKIFTEIILKMFNGRSYFKVGEPIPPRPTHADIG